VYHRHWIILSLTVSLSVVALVTAVAVTRQPARDSAVVLTPQEARLARMKQSVADNPTDFDSQLRLGWTYQQQKRYQEALEQYGIILTRRPRSMATLYYRGLIYREMGLDLPSRDDFRSVLEIRSDHVLAAIALGEYHLERREYDELLQIVRPAAKKHPKVARLQYLMGRGYEGCGDLDRAVARYRKAVKYAPDLLSARERLKRLDTHPESTDFPPRDSRDNHSP
jgi:tetratricopeptide (TPR) repeat protein